MLHRRRREGLGVQKIFCIGRNKTGTTSLARALHGLGYRIGNQWRGESLLEDWARRDFRRIIALCRTADAFQDVPFSLDYTFQAADRVFPGSRFILTVCDSADQWYASLTAFHTRIVGSGRLPTADDLKAYRFRDGKLTGYLWRIAQLVYGVDESTLYDREIYVSHYARHNERVMDYFRHRGDDLLVINLRQQDAMARLCDFLDVPYAGQAMPHLNRSTTRTPGA